MQDDTAMSPSETTKNQEKPVAYNADGQPLYAHPVEEVTPPVVAAQTAPLPAQAPTVVHIARSLGQDLVEIPPEVEEKHKKSKKAYPQLDLSETEFVVLCVHRHMIGLAAPLAVSAFMICLIIAGLFLLPEIMSSFSFLNINIGVLLLVGVMACILLAAGMYTLYWVYINNTFFLTNENMIEKTQLSLFSSNVKSVSLGDVVDVSYRQTGVIEQLFNFGTVQVGTKDDEVPYVFNTVKNPREQTSVLKDAVASYKNGRAIDTNDIHVSQN